MKITKLNLEIRAVKNYQTVSLGAEIEVEEPINMQVLKQIEDKLMNESVEQVNILCDKLNIQSVNEPVKVERVQTYQKPQQQNNFKPQNNFNNQQQYSPVPATQKQAEILSKYGISAVNMNSKDAGQMIKTLREQGGKF